MIHFQPHNFLALAVKLSQQSHQLSQPHQPTQPNYPTPKHHITMADVEMHDAFPSSKGKSPADAAPANTTPGDAAPADASPAAGAAPGAKPRFEVKKACAPPPLQSSIAITSLANNTIG